MLPSDYPGVIDDGIAALNWGGAALERALRRIPEWVAAQAPLNAKALAEAKEKAKRERTQLTVSAFPDAADWERTFTDQRAEVNELATRLGRRTRAAWQSGDAAQYFSGLELRILDSWAHGANEALIAWLGEKPEQIQRRKMEFAALVKWLRDYLDSNV
jgi:hypothetical protein